MSAVRQPSDDSVDWFGCDVVVVAVYRHSTDAIAVDVGVHSAVGTSDGVLCVAMTDWWHCAAIDGCSAC